MIEIIYNKPDSTKYSQVFCVYKMWFNSHYYIGCTSNLSKRIAIHYSIIKRLNKGFSVNKATRKVYRKITKLIDNESFIEINIEVLFVSSSLKEVEECERKLLYSQRNDTNSLNNVKKRF